MTRGASAIGVHLQQKHRPAHSWASSGAGSWTGQSPEGSISARGKWYTRDLRLRRPNFECEHSEGIGDSDIN